ncbi:Protein of unknown function [Gryllus bimaculatus]|nr:Protein of unknown function [Gryllus bimaculatus]
MWAVVLLGVLAAVAGSANAAEYHIRVERAAFPVSPPRPGRHGRGPKPVPLPPAHHKPPPRPAPTAAAATRWHRPPRPAAPASAPPPARPPVRPHPEPRRRAPQTPGEGGPSSSVAGLHARLRTHRSNCSSTHPDRRSNLLRRPAIAQVHLFAHPPEPAGPARSPRHRNRKSQPFAPPTGRKCQPRVGPVREAQRPQTRPAPLRNSPAAPLPADEARPRAGEARGPCRRPSGLEAPGPADAGPPRCRPRCRLARRRARCPRAWAGARARPCSTSPRWCHWRQSWSSRPTSPPASKARCSTPRATAGASGRERHEYQ